MTASERTRDAVRLLWEIGAAHGRVPAPTPEADPWDDPDPLEPRRDDAVVEFRGVPSVVVRLYGDGQDTVRLDDAVDLDLPRRDTLACVDAVLAGRARLRRGAGRHRLWRYVPLPPWLMPTTDALVIPLGHGRTHEEPVPAAVLGGAWVSGLPDA